MVSNGRKRHGSGRAVLQYFIVSYMLHIEKHFGLIFVAISNGKPSRINIDMVLFCLFWSPSLISKVRCKWVG